MKTKLISLLLIVLMLLPAPFAAADREEANIGPDLYFSTTTLAGDPIDSSIAKDYDLVMVNFWAEWCGPCCEELPDLERIHKEYDNVLLIGAWNGHNKDLAIQTAEDAGVTYPMINIAGTLKDYATILTGYPTTFFFDCNGKELGNDVGAVKYETWKSRVDSYLADVHPYDPEDPIDPQTDLWFDTETLDGNPIDSSIIKDYDLIMLTIWDEWCDPCICEMPDLQKIYEDNNDLLILGVYSGYDPESAIATVADTGVTYPLVKPRGALSLYLQTIFTKPSALFFDGNGRQISDVYEGSRTFGQWTAIVDSMKKVLKGQLDKPIDPVVTQPGYLWFRTKTLQGDPISSDIIKDYDLIMIDFWFEGSGRGLPDLQKIYQEYDNVLILGAWTGNDPESAVETAASAGVTYPLVYPNGTLNDYLYAVDYYNPPCFFFGNDGKQIGEYYEGLYSYESWKRIVDGLLETISEKPHISMQPKSTAAAIGKKVKFKVKAEGDDLTYQWYYRTSETAKWKKVSYKSGKKATLSFTAKKAHDGYQYRCTIKNGDGLKTTSETVTLHTGYAPEIKKQPATRKVKIGAKAKFKVAAEGEDLTYQWYYRTSKTAKWKKISGATKPTYTVKMTAKKNGYQYRCLVKNPFGKVYTRAVTLKKK